MLLAHTGTSCFLCLYGTTPASESLPFLRRWRYISGIWIFWIDHLWKAHFTSKLNDNTAVDDIICTRSLAVCLKSGCHSHCMNCMAYFFMKLFSVRVHSEKECHNVPEKLWYVSNGPLLGRETQELAIKYGSILMFLAIRERHLLTSWKHSLCWQ